jgi:hypothetical protein
MSVIIPSPDLEGMPPDVFGYILELWAQSEWCAPAIAVRVSRRIREMTLSTPRAYSNLYIHRKSVMMPDQIHAWLARARSIATRVVVESANPLQVKAALRGVVHSKLLVYQVQEIRDLKGEIIDAEPIDYEALRACQRLQHFRVVGHDWFDPCRARPFRFDVDRLCELVDFQGFVRLIALHLVSVDLVMSTDRSSRIFPQLLQLQLFNIRGDIDTIINACSQTLEDLRISMCNHGSEVELFLPRLRILCLEKAGDIVDVMELPSLKVLNAAAGELPLSTDRCLLSSVTQWTSATTNKSDLEDHSIRTLLRLLPRLECLMLGEVVEVASQFFEELQIDSSLCPVLKYIRVTKGVSLAGVVVWADEHTGVSHEWMSLRSGAVEIEYLTKDEYDQAQLPYRVKVRSKSRVFKDSSDICFRSSPVLWKRLFKCLSLNLACTVNIYQFEAALNRARKTGFVVDTVKNDNLGLSWRAQHMP